MDDFVALIAEAREIAEGVGGIANQNNPISRTLRALADALERAADTLEASYAFCLHVGHHPCAKFDGKTELCCIERADAEPCPPCRLGKALAQFKGLTS